MSKFWSFAGLIIFAGIGADLLTHVTGAKAAYDAGNKALGTTANLVSGNIVTNPN